MKAISLADRFVKRILKHQDLVSLHPSLNRMPAEEKWATNLIRVSHWEDTDQLPGNDNKHGRVISQADAFAVVISPVRSP
jgi:hypothetical protein